MESEVRYLFSFDGELRCSCLDVADVQIWPAGAPGPLLLPPRLRVELDRLGVTFSPEGVPMAPPRGIHAKFRCGYDNALLAYEDGPAFWCRFCTMKEFLSEPDIWLGFSTPPGIHWPPAVDDFRHLPERARWELIALSHLLD